MTCLFITGRVVAFLFFFLLSCGMYAQKTEVTNLRMKADSILGADDELVNGKIYIQEHLQAAGHPFFLSTEWFKGDIMVNGDQFHDVSLKYNLYTDELVLKAERYRGGPAVISLNNEFVDNFNLGRRYFVNSSGYRDKGFSSDFLEMVYQGNFDFLVSYAKLFNNNYNNKTPYGNYTRTVRNFYIYREGDLQNVSSRKMLLSYFEPYKKQIKKFLHKHKIKYGKATYEQLLGLMKFIDQSNATR